jgi:gliding motility-associated-like protein
MRYRCFILLFFIALGSASAQISAPGASTTLQTSYQSGTGDDPIFVFTSQQGVNRASLDVRNPFTQAASSTWKKYNAATRTFEFYASTTAFTVDDQQSNMPDGLYQVEVSDGSSTTTYRAWVFNNWIQTQASIVDSDCSHFVLNGTYSAASMAYYDPASGEKTVLQPNYTAIWQSSGNQVARSMLTTIYSPPAVNTNYTLTLSDNYGSSSTTNITYNSIVPKADFTVEPATGEAPLKVQFNNASQNADTYEWTLYKDIDVIKQEAAKAKGQPVDSVLRKLSADNFTYTYENSGHYKVKLMAVKTNAVNLICSDSLYFKDQYIVADTSWVQVPNVFTPNGDNVNDQFTIQVQSLKSLKMTIFNRWGRKVYSYDNNNVTSGKDTESHAVWNGKIGGSYASPGVYFYVIEAQGRDNKYRKKTGFVHLFRGK